VKKREAKRTAYGIAADLIEAYRIAPGDDSPKVEAALRELHDHLQLKADPDRLIPTMRLNELESHGRRDGAR